MKAHTYGLVSRVTPVTASVAFLAIFASPESDWLDSFNSAYGSRQVQESDVRLQDGSVVYDLALSTDGRFLATAGGGQVLEVWDLREKKQIAEVRTKRQHTFSVALSENSEIAASGGSAGWVTVIDVKKEQAIKQFRVGNEDVKLVAFDGDSSLIVADQSGAVGRWDARQGKRKDKLASLREDLNAAALSPDGAWLAAGYLDGKLQIVDLREGKIHEAGSLSGNVLDIEFNEDGGRFIASGNQDAAVFDCSENGAALAENYMRPGITCLVLPESGDSNWVVGFGSLDAFVLCRADSDAIESKVDTSDLGVVSASAFSAKARRVVLGAGGGVLMILDLP